MQYLVLAATLASATLAAAQVTVNTPASLVECQPAALSWSGGTPPYFPSIIPGGQPSASPLESFAETSNTSITWTVDIASGSSITLQIRDSTGTIYYSDKVTIQTGTSSTCVSSASSATVITAASTAAAGSTGVATTTSAASTASGSSNRAAASSTSTSSGSPTRASSASSSTSSSNSGAAKVSTGIFTVVTAALFALFA